MFFTRTKPYFEYLISESFKEKFSSSNHNLYIFAAKSSPWNSSDTPPDIKGSVQEEINIWNDIIFVKKCLASNFHPVILNRQWQQNQIYTMYEHDIDLYSIAHSNVTNPYYVVNRDLRVYKCIWNNYSTTNPNGTASIYEPGVATQSNNIITPESNSILEYDDGYKWKYMYTISPSNAFKYVTKFHIPVEENMNVKNAAVDGAIHVVKILNGGNNYANGVYTNIKIRKNNNSTDVEDDAEVTIVVRNNKIHEVRVTSIGSGYRTARLDDSLFPSSMINGTGSGAVLKPIISPIGGHGYNVYDELCCSAFMIYNIFENLPDEPPPENIIYRQFGLLYNPIKADNTGLFTELYGNASDLKKYSGKLLYVENRPPIERNPNQQEVFRLVVNL